MKTFKLTAAFIMILGLTSAKAQEKALIYEPTLNANEQITTAVNKARSEQKHVLLMIGGNWCRWCKMFDKWSTETASVDSTIKSDYVMVHINYSKENRNESMLKTLGFPQRFGFPVFLVLDENGNRLHTQNSAYLEEGEGYSEKKVREFLGHWNVESIAEKNYPPKP